MVETCCDSKLKAINCCIINGIVIICRFSFCSFRYYFNYFIGVLLRSVCTVRMVYVFSVVSPLSNGFTVNALVWFSHFLKYLRGRFLMGKHN
jgi:hypothetical protein